VNTSDKDYAVRRHRRRHSAEFKAKVVAACRKPGVSMAAVALDYRLNANLLRRWVVTAERGEEAGALEVRNVAPADTVAANAAFVAVEIQQPVISRSPEIVIELRRGATAVKVSWPIAAAEACSTWLRELLR
jgi:transposase-like protein